MKTLRQSLIDYEMPMLKAIAECRAVSLNSSDSAEAVNRLSEALLSAVDTTIVVDHLSREEGEALQFLLDHGGQLEGPRFSRAYGKIRLMGPVRLERERPWQNPANPAEGLWYRGLIYKGFQVAEQGGQEIVFIPVDIMPLINPAASQFSGEGDFEIRAADEPKVVISGKGRLRENFFRILVYLQTTPVRLQDDSNLLAEDKQALAHCLLPSLLPTYSLSDELDFLLHLGQRAHLLTTAHKRLRPDRDVTRSWLQATPIQQASFLQNSWRTDHTWNDLWQVPGLVPQPTGWDNSPLLARSKIMDFLGQLDSHVNNWISLGDFVTTIKRVDPDFQRPNGDYNSWYIQDPHGEFLMGFEHWDQIEGALIRYLIGYILLLLGGVDCGLNDMEQIDTFRLTRLGQSFLTGRQPDSQTPIKPIFFHVDNKYQVRVPTQASLYDRFQLARFAQLERSENRRTIYRITQASVSRAFKNGVTPDQITAFLTRVTNSRTPLNVIETIRTWGARYATVQLEQTMLLHLNDEQVLSELRQNPDLNRLLGRALTPTTIIIAADQVAELRRLLVELGYLV